VTLEWEAAAGDGCSYVRLYLIFRNGAVEGLEAAFYSVLELSIPLRQLSNDFVWTRCSVTGWNALAKAHHVPSDEAMPGRFMFVQLSHCEAFSYLVKRPSLGVYSRVARASSRLRRSDERSALSPVAFKIKATC
jgi:hypothetical protein